MSRAPGPSPGDGPPPPQEARDLKDQFDQQQTLIAQLKEMLRKNEQQLVNKEKEVEEYATKLSNIKSRTKSKRVPKAGERQDADRSQTETPDLDTPKKEDKGESKEKEETKTTPGRARQGNLVLLRKKLEEQRMMFEQRGKENESKKGIKEMVEQLKAQLDERDLTIQELQKGFQASSSPAKAVVSSAAQQQPVVQQPLPAAENVGEQKHQEMYAQMVYKDNKIIELNNKILELETKVLDLQENIREKDEVIDARTKAISLMSEDFSRRGKTTLDTLDETREEMRVMQQNFVELETKMRAEKEELVQQLEAKECRVLQLEESNKNLESVRFDLSTRNAELQEKVVLMQESKGKEEDQHKVQQLTKQLDEANKQLIKLKAQHKNKVKNLNKQIDSLKKVSDANEEIVRLQNQIAELEEDKGNLQLHLVDFDDLKVSESHWKTQVSELENRVKQQSQDLDTHVHMISLLESEKIELLQGIQKEKEKVATLEEEMLELKTSTSEITNQKVSLEMKIVELEEVLDILTQEKQDLQKELKSVKEQKDEVVSATVENVTNAEPINETEVVSSMQDKSDLLSARNEDVMKLEESLKQAQMELEDARLAISGLQEQQKQMRESSTQAEEDFTDRTEQSHQNEALQQSMRDMENKLQCANNTVAELTALQEQYSHTQECNVEKLKALEAELNTSKATITELIEQQKHSDSLRDTDSQTIKQLDAKLNEMQRICEEQREVIMDLNAKLAAREEEAEMQKEVISQLEQLGVSGEKEEEERSSKISEILKELNEMAGDLEEWKRRCSEVEDRLEILGTEKGELQSRFEEVRNENQDLAKSLRERDERIAAMQTLVDETGRKLQAREENLGRVRSELEGLEQQYKKRCSNLEQELQTKDQCIQKLQFELNTENKKSETAQEQLHEYEDIVSQFRNRFDELETEHRRVLEEMAQKDTVHMQELHALRSELADKIEYIRKLETGRGEIQQLESMFKSVKMQLQVCEQELHTIKQDYTAKNLELERKSSELQEKEFKMKELTEKNKKLIANLKVKALNLKGQEEKLQKYEEIVKAKEVQFNELVKEKDRLEKLLEHSSDENVARVSSLTGELQDQAQRVAVLIGELAEERSKTEQLGDELSRATEKIVNLEKELKVSQSIAAEVSLLKEGNVALANKVSQLEREIGIFQIDLRNRDSQVTLLEEEVKVKNEEEKRLKSLLEQKNQESFELQQMLNVNNEEQQHLKSLLQQKQQTVLNMQQMLQEAEAKSQQDTEKVKVFSQLLHRFEKAHNKLLTKQGDEDQHKDVNMLEQELTDTDGTITELEDKITMAEGHIQAYSALEAKLQEKEAVVESLEQELAKSREQVQHLEDGLANMEERRRSLEGKAEALGLRLEESNRVKEEVVETESMLEQRLTELLEMESLLKKKVETLQFGNEELTQRLEEMKLENSTLKRELSNAEGALRTAQREVEELSPLEASLVVERERVEALEAEMKRAALEAEHRLKEKVAEVKRYTESLESDLRNFSSQLDQAEADRRQLMERCEKLNDEKLNLDDEVESLGQVVEASKARLAELENKNNQLEKVLAEKDLAVKNMTQRLKEQESVYKELQEQVTVLQNEYDLKSTALSEKNTESEQLKEKTDLLNEALEMLTNEKEQLEAQLSKSSSEKEIMKTNFEEIIQHLEEKLQGQVMNEQNVHEWRTEERDQDVSKAAESEAVELVSELENLKAVLEQKDAEIKSYQKRLLRLQFGDAGEKIADVSQERIFTLEDENNHLQEAIRMKDVHISELRDTVSTLNSELGKLTSQIAEYQSLQDKNTHLQEAIRAKDVHISELGDTVSALNVELGKLTQQITEHQNRVVELEAAQNKSPVNVSTPNITQLVSELEEKLSLLKMEKEDIYLELISEKAKQEVALIIRLAEDYASTISESISMRPSVVTFQDSKESSPDSIQTSELALELEEQLRGVITELNLVKAERDEALLRISVLESALPHQVEAIPCLETNDTILMVERVPSQDIETIVVEQPCMSGTDPSEASGFSEIKQYAVEEDITKIPAGWDDGAEEEGWAWGSDEAKLEEEHIQKQLVAQMMAAPAEDLKLRVAALEEHVKDLEVEKEKLSEELRAAQIRAGKMLKKLKDLKLKNESLMKENLELAKLREEKQFSDLDQAIEEELKIRIDALEKEVKDSKAENDTLHAEKETLVKRVDVLTAANERFVEMKERQDMESEVWQQRNRELKNQIEALEWRISELMEERPATDRAPTDDRKTPANAFFSWDKQVTEASSSNMELQEHLSALAADNENLQSLLEEQRNLRLAAEAGLQNLRHAQNETQVETSQAANRLAAENQALRESYEAALIELQNSSETAKALQEEHATVTQESSRLKAELASVQEEHVLCRQECNRLNTELSTLQEQNTVLKQECNRLNTELAALQELYQAQQAHATGDVEAQLQTATLLDLRRQLEGLSAEKSQLEALFQKLVQEHSLLSEHLQGAHTELQQLQQNNENLLFQCQTLNDNLALSNMQKSNLEHEVSSLRSQLETTALNILDSEKETIGRDAEHDRIMELDAELRMKCEEIEALCQKIETLHLEHAQAEREWSAKAERLRKDLDTSNEDLLRERNCHSILAKEHQELQAEFSAQLFEMERNFAEALSLKEKDLENLRIQLSEQESPKTSDKTESSLQHQLLEKGQEVSALLSMRDRLKQQLIEMEERLSVKATDAENLRLQLVQVEKTLQEQVGQRDKDIRNLQQQLKERDARAQELQHMVDEEAHQLSELRELLEDRESAIHKLKDQLSSRKDSFTMPSEARSSGEEQKEESSTDLQQKQSELDLALYMLHQRDVRIDELTLELMQLLEERDTLQLRLSNALRLNEELRSRARLSASASPVKVPASQSSSAIITNEQLLATLSGEPTVVQAVVTEGQENLEALASKISQLRSVGYQRDVTLKDDREQRHTGQMQLLQQRGSGVVVDATYTLSRDVQSPSTVLLNWLWGRSTPKVMHI